LYQIPNWRYFAAELIQHPKKTAMRKAVLLLATAIFFHFSYSQNVTGKIIRAATLPTSNTVLDPIAPLGYTSNSTLGFQGNDVGNAKLGFKPIPAFSIEPFGDLRRGPNHLYSDFVPDVNGAGVYMYFDGTNLLFRMRLGSVVPGAKGYSILIDTDLKFGNTGPNADPTYFPATTGVNGNPGFEREIVLCTGGTNNGILVYDIDNSDNASALTPIQSYTGWTNYSQLSIAGTNDNGDPDFFMDFYIPLSALGGGITANTPLRFNATTVMSGQAAIGGPKSDIYGVNDNSYKSVNAGWEAYINQQPPITPNSLGGSGTTPTSTTACSAAPVITSVTTTGGAHGRGQVTGTWMKSSTSTLTSATIQVYQNGGLLSGNATATSGNTWTYDVPATVTLSAGQTITARAQAPGESMCLFSNNFTLSACNNWAAANLVTPLGDNSNNNYQCFLSPTANTTNKGVGAANRTNSTWTVYVNEAVTNVTRNSTANQGAAFFSSGSVTSYNTTTWTQSATPFWKYSDGCQGGANLTSGVYTFWYQDANGCKSDITPVCVSGNGNGGVLAGTIAVQPTISPSAVTASTTSVTVTGAAGTAISLYYNGEIIASGNIAGTYNGTTTGSVVFSNLSFANGGVLSAMSSRITSGTVTTSYCPAKSVAQTIGLCVTTAPVINADNNGQITAGSPITGYSSEATGTTIRVYNSSGNVLVATTTVGSDGSWSTAPFNAVAGTTYYATAQNSSCTMSAASGSATVANATTNVCGSISTAVDETSTSVSGILSSTPSQSTTVNLYQDGMFVASTTTTTANWTISGLAAGLFNPNSVLSIGIRQGTNQEVSCANRRTVVCATQPASPIIVSPNNPTVGSGATITYTISGITADNFYGIVDANSGRSLANGVWAASNNNITITTYPLTGTTGTVYNIRVKVSNVSNTAVCTNFAVSNVTISGVLPVTVTEFKGRHVNSINELSWKTANEINFKQYDVERSTDGRSFFKIGEVTANQSGLYSFTDQQLTSNANYYRLKLVNNDGSFTYSQVVLLKHNNTIVINTVKPNPFIGEVELQLSLTRKEVVGILLFDERGRQVASKQVTAVAGSNTIKLPNLQQLSAGVYLLKVVTEGSVLQQKLIKLK